MFTESQAELETYAQSRIPFYPVDHKLAVFQRALVHGENVQQWDQRAHRWCETNAARNFARVLELAAVSNFRLLTADREQAGNRAPRHLHTFDIRVRSLKNITPRTSSDCQRLLKKGSFE